MYHTGRVQRFLDESEFTRDFNSVFNSGLSPLLPAVLTSLVLEYSKPFLREEERGRVFRVEIGAQVFLVILNDDLGYDRRFILWEGDTLKKLVYDHNIPRWNAELTEEREREHWDLNCIQPNARTLLWKPRTRPVVPEEEKDRWLFLLHRPMKGGEHHAGFLFPSTTSKQQFLLGLKLISKYAKSRSW